MQNNTQNEEVNVEGYPNEWSRIKVPFHVKEYIKDLAERRGLPVWKYVLMTVDFYETAMKNQVVSETTKLQNNSYYATRLIAAVTEYLHRPTQQVYEKLMKIIDTTEKRKRIDLSVLRTLVNQYMNTKNKKATQRAIFQELVRINAELMTS